MNVHNPLLHQDWSNLLFLHWEIEPEQIQKTLPSGLKVDTYDGKAYLGIVAFEMQNLRLHGFIPFPGISDFVELNLRTYVRDEKGRSGVWFYSLEAASTISVWIANTFFSLPYRNASMSVSNRKSGMNYRTVARRDPQKEEMEFDFEQPTDSPLRVAQKDTLDYFLVERYRLFTVRNRSKDLISGKIYHNPYQVCDVKLNRHSTALFRLNGFAEPLTPPISSLFSPGVNVDLFGLKKSS